MNLNMDEWKEFYLKNLYDIQMGNGFDKNKLDEDNPEINLVSRVSYNNGVDVKVGYVNEVEPFESGLVTVALGGSYLGSCFVQEEPFYTGQNVAVMKGKFDNMTHIVNIFISGLVRFECTTKYYAFGRELNTHIKTDFTIKLPIQHNADGTPYIDANFIYSEDGYVPDWQFMKDYMKSLHHKPLTTKNTVGNGLALNVDEWKEFTLDDVFVLRGGFYNKKPEHSIDGNIPFLASTESNNGVTEFYSIEDIRGWDKVGNEDNTLDKKMYAGNCIAVTVNGSVCNAFYQHEDFTCSHDITAFYVRDYTMSPYLAMFLCTIIMQDKYRWSYGRKPHDVKKFGKSAIKLPIQHNPDATPYIDPNCTYSEDGYVPDWQFMEDYIKALPYGDRL